MTTCSIGKRCRTIAGLNADFQRTIQRASIDEDASANVFGFIVGSSLLTGTNELITVGYSEEKKIVSEMDTSVFLPGELWDLAPHAQKEGTLLASWCSSTEGRGLSLLTESSAHHRLEGGEGCRAVKWEKSTTTDKFVSVHQNGSVKLWTFREGSEVPVVLSQFYPEDSAVPKLGNKDVCFDPHHPNLVFAANSGDEFVREFDLRTNNSKGEALKFSTGSRVLSLDVNPNRPNLLCTGGEDPAVQFFDTRSTAGGPLKRLVGGHAHWVSKVRYNPFHDQLVISGSTDGTVCLWRAQSVSSAPLMRMEDVDHPQQDVPDVLVRTFEEYKDSVYGLAWSEATAWVYASVSYAGRVCVHTVPSKEKYKILL